MKSYVYAHFLPDTGEIIYIGQGKGYRAFDTHRRNPEHLKVLTNIGNMGYTPVDYAVIVAQDMTEREARDLETKFIKTLRPLFNQMQLSAANAGRGEANPRSILTNDLVAKLRKFYEEPGTSIRGTAKHFGLKYSCVRKVLTGEAWTHV